jgi:CRISPR-associated protein Csb2
MKPSLCISFRFIQPYPLFHGRGDADEPEWPPSPMRAFQALLNAACLRTRGKPLPPEVRSALQELEVLRPSIAAPRATLSTIGHRAYVPHNQTDLVATAWHRGNYDASIASHRVEKDFRPHRIELVGDELPTIHYLYALDTTNADPRELLNAIRPSVRSIHCLGWGIDQVVADVTLVESSSKHVTGKRWTPDPRGGRRLRVHRNGSLDALSARHDKFLNRLIQGDWTPVPPLSTFDFVGYRSQDEPIQRPYRVFELRNIDGSRFRYPHAKFLHIAGMARHLAIEEMKRFPPRGVDGKWVETYVAGHRTDGEKDHRQLSYLPLCSIGHEHTDPGVRRVMIAAPVGDDVWLDHVARRLAGQTLKPVQGDEFAGREPPLLVPVYRDNIAPFYSRPASVWDTFTPVILPGHDDHKPGKTRALIEKALSQADVDQPCEFEWSTFSRFRKSYSAHKYDRDKRPQGYFRPNHLLSQTAVHLTLRFHDGSPQKTPVEVPGPLVIGAGRHCGFGLFAAATE